MSSLVYHYRGEYTMYIMVNFIMWVNDGRYRGWVNLRRSSGSGGFQFLVLLFSFLAVVAAVKAILRHYGLIP